jgi:hypothetical protein
MDPRAILSQVTTSRAPVLPGSTNRDAIARSKTGRSIASITPASLSLVKKTGTQNHCRAVTHYFIDYNFVRINQAVRVSPTMTATGIETRL